MANEENPFEEIENEDFDEQEGDIESASMEDPPDGSDDDEEVEEDAVEDDDDFPDLMSTSGEGMTSRDEDVAAAQSEIEAILMNFDQPDDSDDPEFMGVRSADFFDSPNNLLGVGVTSSDAEADDFEEGPCVTVYTAEPCNHDEACGLISNLGVQGVGTDVPMRVISVGEDFEIQPYKGKYRPAPGGSSIGHYKITAGTLGCLARACRKTGGCYKPGDRRRRVLILSNNHVMANSNAAKCLDRILQPGPYDGGKNPRDKIALLEKWVPIRYGKGKVNYTDCATAWAWPRRVDRRIWWGKSRIRVNSRPIWSRRGMVVCKSGRTTQSRRGRIIDNSWSGWVNYGAGKRAFFRKQFVVRGIGKTFSAGGDSGSLVWRSRGRRPTGLLFAGGGGLTICNRIQYVMSNTKYGLDIRLWT